MSGLLPAPRHDRRDRTPSNVVDATRKKCGNDRYRRHLARYAVGSGCVETDALQELLSVSTASHCGAEPLRKVRTAATRRC